ncbi:MAG: primosomal protein N' [Clostridiales bacterium]|nr:primosomal protein N' [Clostridiales bacterium]
MQFVDVVIDNKSNSTDAFFTYSAPDEVRKGARLSVQFAGRKKPLDAYCVRAGVEPHIDTDKIKEIVSWDPERSLNEEMIDTAVWMRKRYGVRYIDAIKMFTTGGKRIPASRRKGGEGFDPGYELSSEQTAAAERICDSVRKRESAAYLIKGVTNSGKTEVYMRAAEQALELGRNVIILLPEIALSAQVERRFRERFGDIVATLHSRLTTSARLGEWMRIRRGEARIVVGARTSVFAPLDDIGLIVIDEEHESTYKSDHTPKYDTVDVAYYRAVQHDAVLVMGSATPSVVSYYRAKTGVYRLIEMNRRIGDSIMPRLETVDMRKEAPAGNTSVISRRLAAEIDRALARKEQVILFLNRRGFSTQILCPDCGYKMTCPDCGITLTYHKSADAAVCHYCGRRFGLPDSCPDCGNRFIKYVGAGTEKVEETVQELWPHAAVARFDLDTAASSDDVSSVISDFQNGKTDILVGTQILAKGLDFRNVGLVGIINADVSLNIPDYRSSERTYQLITQVAGRAGRAGGSSLVLIQTYDPESDVLREAAAGDYDSFYESELLHRNIMNYPPYSDIIAVGFSSESSDTAMKYAAVFRERLSGLKSAPSDAVILRPRLEERRSDGRARAVFLIKAPLGSRSGYIREYMEFRERMTAAKADCYIDIDVNPYSTV